VIYEHGELWWNDVHREQLVIGPKQFSGISTSRVIRYQAGGRGEGNDKLGLPKDFCSYIPSDFSMP
jgi:hypothetical protein